MSTYIDPSRNNYPGLDRGFNQRYKLDAGLSADDKEGVYLVYNADDILAVLKSLVTPETFNSLAGKIRMISGGIVTKTLLFRARRATPMARVMSSI